MSEFTFETYILFVGSVSGALRKDPSLTVFGIENAKDTAVKLIKEGLVEEGNAKEYIDNSSLTIIMLNLKSTGKIIKYAVLGMDLS